MINEAKWILKLCRHLHDNLKMEEDILVPYVIAILINGVPNDPPDFGEDNECVEEIIKEAQSDRVKQGIKELLKECM